MRIGRRAGSDFAVLGRGASRWLAFFALAAVVTLAAACGRAGERAAGDRPEASAAAPSAGPASPSLEAGTSAAAGPTSASAASAAAGPLVVFLGDSLTAGFGLEEDAAYPAFVAAELDRRGIAARVINAGVSGDTSAGGLARLDWLLAQEPDVVVVALGANDGLRGQPLESIAGNLRAIVERSRAAGARVLLAGMKIPPNYGPEYTAGFEQLYVRLARELDVELIPFLLDGVAARPELNLPDGIHPNGDGQRIIAGTVADALGPMLAELAASS